ncbi:MAG: hypothetical protein V1789_06760 [PVC group bacterium]
MNEEQKFLEKIKHIEALFAGATTTGERAAAAGALERIHQRLQKLQKLDPLVEFKFTLGDMWSRKLFVALLRRYGIKPYRYRGQRYTTVMAKMPETFVQEILWPEYIELDKTLTSYLGEVTNRVIIEGIYSDNSEAEIREGKV